VLSGKNQQDSLARGTSKPVNKEVHETAVTSRDGGCTWEPWFDLMFRRSAGSVTKTDLSATYAARDDRVQFVAQEQAAQGEMRDW
jgi:hypothetical protein